MGLRLVVGIPVILKGIITRYPSSHIVDHCCIPNLTNMLQVLLLRLPLSRHTWRTENAGQRSSSRCSFSLGPRHHPLQHPHRKQRRNSDGWFDSRFGCERRLTRNATWKKTAGLMLRALVQRSTGSSICWWQLWNDHWPTCILHSAALTRVCCDMLRDLLVSGCFVCAVYALIPVLHICSRDIFYRTAVIRMFLTCLQRISHCLADLGCQEYPALPSAKAAPSSQASDQLQIPCVFMLFFVVTR